MENSYEIGEVLGEGGFGTVHKGTHIENRENVAIKYVFKNKMIDSDWILINGQRIPLELRLLDKVPFINYVSIQALVWWKGSENCNFCLFSLL